MLKVVEFFDIDAIASLRDLDKQDNFSYQLALFDGDELLGVGRLYRREPKSQDIFIDKIALKYEENAWREMIFRSLLLKCFYIPCKNVFAKIETEEKFYKKFNMEKEEDCFWAPLNGIVFPKECGK